MKNSPNLFFHVWDWDAFWHIHEEIRELLSSSLLQLVHWTSLFNHFIYAQGLDAILSSSFKQL